MLRILSFVDAVIRAIVTAAFAISAAAMLAIMVIGSADVLGTFLFSEPVPAALEAQEVLLAISIFLALGYAQSRREHISVDIVTNALPPSLRRWFGFLALLVGAATFAVIAWRSWILAMASWEIRETANAILTFPIFPGKFLVSIGAAIGALECTRQAARWFVTDDAGDRQSPIEPIE